MITKGKIKKSQSVYNQNRLSQNNFGTFDSVNYMGS